MANRSCDILRGPMSQNTMTNDNFHTMKLPFVNTSWVRWQGKGGNKTDPAL